MYRISYMTGLERMPGRGDVSMRRGFPGRHFVIAKPLQSAQTVKSS